MVGLGRLELPTSRLSSARSNQLSYKPEAQSQPWKPRLDKQAALAGQARPSQRAFPWERACPCGRKRNEGGEVPHVRPCRPVVPSDPIGGNAHRIFSMCYVDSQQRDAGLPNTPGMKDHP